MRIRRTDAALLTLGIAAALLALAMSGLFSGAHGQTVAPTPDATSSIAALLALIPTAWVPYATAAVTICSVACIFAPAPKTTSGWYYVAYQIVSTVAGNMRHAKSLSAPESTGIVGGATAISAPAVATASVPLASATVLQRAATVPPTGSKP